MSTASSDFPPLPPISESSLPTKSFQFHVPTNKSNMTMYIVVLLVVLCCCLYCCLSSSLMGGGLFYEYGQQNESFNDGNGFMDVIRNLL